MSIETDMGKIVRRLKGDGWVAVHGGRHDIYAHPQKPGQIVVPRHRTISTGVARQIAKAAGWI